LKLLLDQGLPRSAAQLLREAGYDAVHTGEIGLFKASDRTILEFARIETRCIVTLDADFHALLVFQGTKSPSVIRIRIEGLKAEETAELLKSIVKQCTEDLQHGAMISVQPHRIGIRRLPLNAG
jgi:predicted nuclease of predicted toxin-antitoxin system